MTYDADGLNLTEASEGLRQTAYQDSVGVWTIGYGHTGSGVRPGLTISMDQAVSLLQGDLASAEAVVNSAVQVPLTQGEFDAMVDFTFNLGETNFLHSTLLKLVNAGKFAEAAAEFAKWVNAGGKRVQGLVLRREREEQMFLRAA